MIELLLLAVGAMWVFKKKEESNLTSGGNPTASVGQYRPSQPSQKFPWQPIVSVRSDNATQPWYGGSQAAMQGPSSILREDVLKSGNDVSSLWDTLNSYFGDSPKQNLIAQQSVKPTAQNTDNDSNVVVDNITNYGG